MFLRLRSGTLGNKKQAVVEAWYRKQIREAVPPLIAKWEPVIGVTVEEFFVQKMKTKWGSCNSASKTIRLNTDLAKKPPQCLEYTFYGRGHAGRLAEFRTAVSFFGPNRFDADCGGAALEVSIARLLKGKGVHNALLHYASIQNRCKDHGLV